MIAKPLKFTIMQDGGFVLRKWTSNSKAFRQRVTIHQQTTRPREQDLTIDSVGSRREAVVNDNTVIASEARECILKPSPNENYQDTIDPSKDRQPENNTSTENEDCAIKILGVSWNVETDEFEYDLKKWMDYAETLTPTRRSVIRLSAKIFDPLGFLAPFIPSC